MCVWSARILNKSSLGYGPLARYVKLRVAHAPGMPGKFSPPARVSDADIHYGTCATHMPWCMPGSLTSRFLLNRWRGKLSRRSQRLRNLQFYVSGKRPIGQYGISIRNSSWTQISWSLVHLWYLCHFADHFEILRRTRQYHCRFCTICQNHWVTGKVSWIICFIN